MIRVRNWLGGGLLLAAGVVIALPTALDAQNARPAQPGQQPEAAKVSDEVQAAVGANNTFAVRLYKQLASAEKGENLFFSPYSLQTALTMAAQGARDETAVEMGEALAYPKQLRQAAGPLPWQMETLHSGFAALTKDLTASDQPQQAAARERIARLRVEHKKLQAEMEAAARGRNFQQVRTLQTKANAVVNQLNEALGMVDQYELAVANALWGEQTYPFAEPYVQTIDRFYETGGIRSVDFRNNFPAARKEINTWVNEQTKGRIDDIIPDLPPAQAKLLRLILTNAIYFKGQWQTPFEKAKTKAGEFTLGDGSTTNAQLMHASELSGTAYAAFTADGKRFPTPKTLGFGGETPESTLYPQDGFHVASLPYKGDRLSMMIATPLKAEDFSQMEKTLTSEDLTTWLEQLKPQKIHVVLPKFELNTKYKMNEVLQSLGMQRAFIDPAQPNGANFSGMSASSDPADRLWISAVLHKAYLNVNEEGTEAAAATAVLMFGATSAQQVPFVPTVAADRPFVFAIRDNHTGAILFLGRLLSPAT